MKARLAVGVVFAVLVASFQVVEAEDNPLAGLPSAPGPHIAAIDALGDNEWLVLDQPAADPDWGLARGRSWTSEMAFASDLGGAFFCATGVHGYVKPDGHYMDDLWFYDAMANEWICLYPGADCATLDLVLDANNFEVTHAGVDNPVSYLSHGYNNLTYVSHLQKYMIIYTICPWWANAVPQRYDWLNVPLADRTSGYNTGDLNTDTRHPVFWDVQNNRWERILSSGYSPMSRFEGVLEYIPSTQQAFFLYRGDVLFYDFDTATWTDSGAPTVPIAYDSNGCYDSTRGRVYIAKGTQFYSFDISSKTWTEITAPGQPASLGATNYATLYYDSANDVIIWHGHDSDVYGTYGAIAVYDPGTNEWTAMPDAFPAGDFTYLHYALGHGFYYPALNAYFCYVANDSGLDNAKFAVYRYRTAERYDISGTISGAGDVTLTLSGDASATTTSDGAGNYSFTGLVNGSYTVTPSKVGFEFSPAGAPVSVNGADAANVNFTATSVPTYTITATAGAGGAIDPSGPVVVNEGTDVTFTITADYGYEISDVVVDAAGQGPLTEHTFPNVTADHSIDASFSALPTYTIYGTVSGDVAAGVTVTLSGDADDTTVTDGAGDYSFSGLLDGAYTVTPSLGGYTFSPTSTGVIVSGADVYGVDFNSAEDPGLVLWLKMDGDADDYSGYDNHGTTYGDPVWTTGRLDQGLEFNGDDYVDCGTDPSLAITGALTVATWVRVDSTGAWPRIIQRGSADGNGFALRLNGSRFIFQAKQYDAAYNAQSDANLTTGEWYHVAGVYDGTNPPVLYVDGAPQSGTVSDNAGSAGSSLNVGRRAGENSYFFSGAVDDVRVYGRQLSETEIQALAMVADTSPPLLDLSAVVLSGTATDDTTTITEVNVDGTPVTVTGGNWVSDDIAISGASTSIPVSAQDSSGNTASLTVTVQK